MAPVCADPTPRTERGPPMHRSPLSAVLSLSLLLSALATTYAASYTFTTVDVPGALSTMAYGINPAGQIVGQVGVLPGGSHGFVTDGTTFTTLDVPGSGNTEAYGINPAGQIVGGFYDATGGPSHGFVTDGTTFTTLDVPGTSGTTAFRINRVGQIVGVFRNSPGMEPLSPNHGFVTDGVTFTTIDVPDALDTLALGINRDGKIVGQFRDATSSIHGFVTDGATFTTLDVPGAVGTIAHGINGAGQIVGSFSYGDGTGSHGFVTDGVTFTTIDVPGATHTIAHGINGAGQIVGFWFNNFQELHSFVATPDEEVDMSPPLITISASPATLSPPNGKLVTVTVSGTITDHEPGGSGISSAAYQVIDEYGQIQPSGSLTLEADGRYSFTVALQASRRGSDPDGRHYTIAVSADDDTENLGVAPAIVTVPRK